MSCGPTNPIWAGLKDGVAIAADHCSRTSESHGWPCTCEARGPAKVVSHVCRRCQAGHLSWDCTWHSHRWHAVSGPLSHSKHRVLSRTLWCAEHSASTVMMGTLRMQWATRCQCWSLVTGEPVQGQAVVWPVVRSPPMFVVCLSGDRSLLLQPLWQVHRG